MNKIFAITVAVWVIFLAAVVTDFHPNIRGPKDNLAESRWPYYYVNTWSKVWVPLLAGGVIIIWVGMKVKRDWVWLGMLVGMTLAWQLSLVYFSRFGLGVLFRRTADLGINGYFSTAVKTGPAGEYVRRFPVIKNSLDQHARSHPPGTVVMMKGMIAIFERNLALTEWVMAVVPPADGEAKRIWDRLTREQRAAAIGSALWMHLLASVAVVGPYFFAKVLFGEEAGRKTAVVYSLIPAGSFFALLGDPWYAFWPAVSFALLAAGVKKQRMGWAILAGVVMAGGMWFSLVPVVVTAVAGVWLVLKKKIRYWMGFGAGILGVMGLLATGGVNMPAIYLANFGDQMGREYLPWLWGNAYDFGVYIGVVVTVGFLGLGGGKLFGEERKLWLAWWVIFGLLVVSGVSRGEVGRIWLPLMFIPVALVVNFWQRVKLGGVKFAAILVMLVVQTVVMEEFWVPIW